MDFATRIKLSAMFFLNIFIWGAWLPLMNNHLEKLGFTGQQQGYIGNTFAIASLTAMIFGGQLVDRYFAAEKFMAISNFIGGAAMLALPFQKEFWPFFTVMLIHCFFYVPTVSVANAIAFANSKDAADDFGKLRLWGTIGWIAAGFATSFVVSEAKPDSTGGIFMVAGIASILLGFLSFSLPHTPPQNSGSSDSFAPFKALALLAAPTTAVLAIVTFFDAMVHAGYFFYTGRFLAYLGFTENEIPRIMTIGQFAEIVTMAVLGITLKKLGWRTTMIFGVLAHALRFSVYALSGPDQRYFVVASILVHGFCYAFFFATVYIFVDEYFPKDSRTSAQSLFNLIILGVGPFVGNLLWGWLNDRYTDEATKKVAFNALFWTPAGIALLGAVLLMLFFHPPKRTSSAEVAP